MAMIILKLFLKKIIFVYMLCAWICTCHRFHVGVRGQLGGMISSPHHLFSMD